MNFVRGFLAVTATGQSLHQPPKNKRARLLRSVLRTALAEATH